MKKYTKPMILVENFILSSSIAGSCLNSGYAFQNDCVQNYDINAIKDTLDQLDGKKDGKVSILDEGMETDLVIDGQIIKVCYHTSQGVNVFTS